MSIAPPTKLLSSGVVRLFAVSCNLFDTTDEVTPGIAAALIAPDNPATVLVGLAGTGTDVPLITIVSLAVSPVGAKGLVSVGQDCFHKSDPSCTHAFVEFL
jgi:hypothetical protein